MDKPMSILIEETKQELIDVVNRCKLHPSIIELIIKDVYWEINQIKINTIAKEQKMMQESTEK